MIEKVIELKGIEEYIISRGLVDQYSKMKEPLLNGNFRAVNFKKRKPYSQSICYCRINKKYRAWGYLEDNVFFVVKIDDH